MNDDQADRLTRAEVILQQHAEMHRETAAAIQRMADGIQKLAESEVRREQDQQTFGRIFDEIKNLRGDFEAYKETMKDKEIKVYQGIVWKSISLSGLILASVVAARLGAHLLG